MILLGLCAFVAGVFVGWISLRALGWLCLLFLFTTTQANAVSYVHMANTSGGAAKCKAYFWNGSSYVLISEYSFSGNGTEDTGNFETERMKAEWSDDNWATIAQTDIFNPASPGANNTTFTGATPSNYYVYGCMTNNTRFLQRYHLVCSNGHIESSPPIPPGGFWCATPYTNDTPFTYGMTVQGYNSDGATNDWTFNMGDGFPAWTNTFPPPGGTGSVTDTGGRGNNMGQDTGYGSTNALTGGQYAAGISNLMNGVYGGFQDMARGLSSLSSSNNSNQTGLLSAISNNTAIATNTLREILAQTGTNVFGSNALSWTENALSNTAFAIIGPLSNNWKGVLWGSAEEDLANSLTNLAVPAPEMGLFRIPVYTNTGKTGYLNLDPRQTNVWNQMGQWVRSGFIFMGTIFALFYIKYRVTEEAIRMGLVPGSAPWKSIGSTMVTGASLVVVGIIFAMLPVILLNFISWLTGWGSLINPLSEEGVTQAGNYSTHIREGLDYMQDMVPLNWMLTLLVYLAIFDATVAAFIIAAQRALRVIQA